VSERIALGKCPGSPEERKQLIESRLAEEGFLEQVRLTYVQRKIVEFLLSQKGYRPDDIEIDREFAISLSDVTFVVKADVSLVLNGRRFMVITCAVNSLESWERHASAFCRVVEEYQIPYAVVTDGTGARVLDAIHDRVISEGVESIPTRAEAVELLAGHEFSPCPEGRYEREKRILYAFDAIRCPFDYPKT
jgi:hypothetical protein